MRGYFVFHTDIVPSTHLKSFTPAGATPGPEIVFLLGKEVDELVHDPVAGRVYLPTSDAWHPGPLGLYVIDDETDRAVGFLSTQQRAHDAVLMRP